MWHCAGIRLTLRNEQHDLDSITSQKKTETGKRGRASVDDEDEMDFEAELEHLLEEPPKKRYMRMHADDEEDRIKAKRYLKEKKNRRGKNVLLFSILILYTKCFYLLHPLNIAITLTQ